MLVRIVSIFACYIAVAMSVWAEPSNVLVGDLTFVRPEKWTWAAPEGKSAAVTRFLVPDTSGGSSSTSASFYHGPKDAPAAFNAWKSRFPNRAELEKVQTEQKTIKDRLLTYYIVTGTYAFAGPPRPDQTFIGAVMPSNGKFVHVLLVGPSTDVRAATGDFKRMIETALREAE